MRPLSEARAAPGGRLAVLDSLRGICALCVALMHVNIVSPITLGGFVRGSWLFVDFFFVLSGFVIAFAYLERIGSAGAAVEFVIRRFGRLWPLHAFVLLLFVLSEASKALGAHAGMPTHTAAFAGHYAPGTLPANLLLVHSLGLYDDVSWNPPSWSISVEFYTYLVFAGLCLAARKWLPLAAAGVIGIAVAVLWLRSPQYLAASLDYGFFRCLYGFFVGVLTLFAWRRVPRLPAARLCEAGSIGLAIGFVLACRTGDALTMAAPLVFAGAVFTFAFEQGPVSKLLALRGFTWLGERSYGIYMVHAFIVYLATRVLVTAGGLLHRPLLTHMEFAGSMTDVVALRNPYAADAALVFYLAAVAAAAHLVYVAVERPGRAFFNRLAVTLPKARLSPAASAVRGRPR